MINTGSSVVRIDTRFVPGGSLAENLFHIPIDGKIKCQECSLAVFELINVGDSAAIKISSRHFGQKHWSIIPIEKLGLRLA